MSDSKVNTGPGGGGGGGGETIGLYAVRPSEACPGHISYTIRPTDTKLGVWIHHGMALCQIPIRFTVTLTFDLLHRKCLPCPGGGGCYGLQFLLKLVQCYIYMYWYHI